MTHGLDLLRQHETAENPKKTPFFVWSRISEALANAAVSRLSRARGGEAERRRPPKAVVGAVPEVDTRGLQMMLLWEPEKLIGVRQVGTEWNSRSQDSSLGSRGGTASVGPLEGGNDGDDQRRSWRIRRHG